VIALLRGGANARTCNLHGLRLGVVSFGQDVAEDGDDAAAKGRRQRQGGKVLGVCVDVLVHQTLLELDADANADLVDEPDDWRDCSSPRFNLVRQLHRPCPSVDLLRRHVSLP
jgi:hypothetical protein